MIQKNLLTLTLLISLIGLTGCNKMNEIQEIDVQPSQTEVNDEVEVSDSVEESESNETSKLGILPKDFFQRLNEINPELNLNEEMFEEIFSGYHMCFTDEGQIITYWTYEKDDYITPDNNKLGMMHKLHFQMDNPTPEFARYFLDFTEAFDKAGMNQYVELEASLIQD